MVYYCKKCGRIVGLLENEEKICDCCNNKVYPVPIEYTWDGVCLKAKLKEQFINDYIKSSPEFDPDWFERKDEIVHQRSMEMRSLLDTSNKVTCPYCHSVNVRKLPKRTIYFSQLAFLGRNLSEVGKNFHCNKCGADF